jgi:hypothetical protein
MGNHHTSFSFKSKAHEAEKKMSPKSSLKALLGKQQSFFH